MVYLATGFYGTLWVSDEFDEYRGIFYGIFALPFLTLYCSQIWYRPTWWKDNPLIFWTCTLVLCLAFSWGNAILLNAVSGNKKAVVNITMEGQKYAVTQRRGGLEWLYRPRW